MSNPLSYYIDLLTSQYWGKPNLTAMLTALLQVLKDAQNCVESIDAAFDIDIAVGVQLDTLGVVVGQARQLNFTPTSGDPLLNDDDYRIVLKAKMAQNIWDGTITSLQTIWSTLFPGGNILVLDNFNMTMSIALSGVFSDTMRDCIRNGIIIPKPEGVGIIYLLGSLPFFGFDIDNGFVSSFDKGSWSYTTEPIFFGFDENNSTVSGFDTGSWTN